MPFSLQFLLLVKYLEIMKIATFKPTYIRHTCYKTLLTENSVKWLITILRIERGFFLNIFWNRRHFFNSPAWFQKNKTTSLKHLSRLIFMIQLEIISYVELPIHLIYARTTPLIYVKWKATLSWEFSKTSCAIKWVTFF